MIHSNIPLPLLPKGLSAQVGANPTESTAIPFLLGPAAPERAALGDKIRSGVSGDGGLVGQYPWRSVPLHVSNDLAPPYFDIFRAPEKSLTAILRAGGDWRWRFCTANGAVLAAGGGYKTEQACVEAVDALRQAAGTAEIRRRTKISSLPRPILT